MKKITIKLGRIGHSVTKLSLPEKITVKKLLKDVLNIKSKSLHFAINGKIVSLDTTLTNDDFLVIIPEFHAEATIRRSGNVWRIHSNDLDDIFPSSFHAHNLETGEKLDLNTGLLYDPVTNKPFSALHKKDWLAILLKLKSGKDNVISLKAISVLSSLKH